MFTIIKFADKALLYQQRDLFVLLEQSIMKTPKIVNRDGS